MTPTEYKRAWRHANPDKVRAADAKFRAAHPKEYREMHRRSQRNARKKNSALYYGFKKSWNERNPIKHAAHVALAHAVEHGKLIRPDHCSRCGVICFPQGHHPDYSKPLEVVWVCRPCHELIHRQQDRS